MVQRRNAGRSGSTGAKLSKRSAALPPTSAEPTPSCESEVGSQGAAGERHRAKQLWGIISSGWRRSGLTASARTGLSIGTAFLVYYYRCLRQLSLCENGSLNSSEQRGKVANGDMTCYGRTIRSGSQSERITESRHVVPLGLQETAQETARLSATVPLELGASPGDARLRLTLRQRLLAFGIPPGPRGPGPVASPDGSAPYLAFWHALPKVLTIIDFSY